MADRFYTNCPLAPGLVTLQGPEAHHLAAVCRFRPGDQVCLFNGDGHEYPATVVAVARRSVTLDVSAVETPLRESEVHLEVAAALPKGDRAQFLVEKLTELGVHTFVPLRTQRSMIHPRETKRDKLQRYAVEASKQCGRNVLLSVETLVEWDVYCEKRELPTTRYLAHPGGTAALNPAGQDRVVAVGPEGGFTSEEVERARAAGWQLVHLGSRTLRVETAALVLASWAGGCPGVSNPVSARP